ncbi:class I SAM-dependent methyltransferase [Gemmobacter lutimaris]|uniref:class I SAM-dependent methyltransferase n=1 Tax=Gemmobacter lutimaris TaxID=2306023 RepID=UPI0018F562A3|nr:class I SAM-dependent methyltransferase [Gemmobacter lutimaris]
MQREIDIEAEAQRPEVRALDLSAFGQQDLVNLILQRSEVLFDWPRSGRVIKAWNAGDEGPITEAADTLGAEIAYRAAGVIFAEYSLLAPVLQKLAPKRFADIGCGYALFDLFLARDTGCDLLLIDLESNERRQFGFAKEGAAYSSLATARAVLEANGIDGGRIALLNPRETAPEDAGPVDCAASFLSCGFHYPLDPYLPFLDKALAPGGAALFDLRTGRAEVQRAQLAAFGEVETLAETQKYHRVLLRKGKAE